jgi:hypothetical protein
MAEGRRAFLKSFMVPSIVAAALSARDATEAASDEFTVGDWRCVWSGWREPSNQAIRFGYWIGVNDGDGRAIYSTTLGWLDPLDHWSHVMNLSRQPGWPECTIWQPIEVFNDAKARARRVLHDHIIRSYT